MYRPGREDPSYGVTGSGPSQLGGTVLGLRRVTWNRSVFSNNSGKSSVMVRLAYPGKEDS